MAQLEMLEEIEEVDFAEEEDDVEGESANQKKLQLKEISETVVAGSDWTTATIRDQLIRENIQLNPRFQRRDAWNITRKSRFIESLILGFPVPLIVLATNNKEKGKFIVLDGKQRLLTILQFYGDSATPNNSFTLKDLEFLDNLNGCQYQDLKNDFNLNDISDQLDNQTIRTIVIRNWKTENFLHKIFLRLNVENTPLSSQELRQALHPGGFINFLDDRAIESQALKKIFKSSYPDFRMRDTDILLRYVAFHYYLSDYRGDLKGFLDNACVSLNARWDQNSEEIKNIIDQFEKAVQTTINIFGEKNFSRLWLPESATYRSQFNRAILDVMVFYFCDDLIRAAAEKNKEQVEEAFKSLFRTAIDRFKNAVLISTNTKQSTYDRFHLWGQALSKVLDINFNIPQMEDNRIIFKGVR
ncbi:MAG: DUF262 domain-containing protein [Microcystis sp. M54BS1]|uniref:DUF262 domain-containing protein n=1 Tax=unclassified Microcystis TaxID=2643300 RepID=UPI00257E22AB|nr:MULTISPECIES: DUF262 domain-containing protein [unclassified Microcystis]MCA2538197.1 DUF262 domain-containing protein [Microcystis sp. M54BS1]MCA2595734.1 DUF262 domain-containing protein [Microcystis sp. M38BS1]MCA2609716.1 DUF262 domain-containing protein [Microcystis sp. M27BS1]MCA2506340.1 DUF262 domain-containing protein [Microcystis sp. M62BS1]MCA2508927.1 DUF262 domain-containing protein [Microcystis sp. M60BS1]